MVPLVDTHVLILTDLRRTRVVVERVVDLLCFGAVDDRIGLLDVGQPARKLAELAVRGIDVA